MSAQGSALVCLSDTRAELATVLILQELGMSVDLASDVESAINWVTRARYHLLVLGGTGIPAAQAALRLRRAAPAARIVVLTDDWEPPEGLTPADVEVLRPPVDVNAMMRSLWPDP